MRQHLISLISYLIHFKFNKCFITYIASSDSLLTQVDQFFSKRGYKINWISLTDKNRPKKIILNS